MRWPNQVLQVSQFPFPWGSDPNLSERSAVIRLITWVMLILACCITAGIGMHHQGHSMKHFSTYLIRGKLSDFDMSFLQKWLHKKDKGRVAHADEHARNLAVLYSNCLREKMYTTTAPMLELPSARQAWRIWKDFAFQGWKVKSFQILRGWMDGPWILHAVEKWSHCKMAWMVPELLVSLSCTERNTYLGKNFPLMCACGPVAMT